jgi:hypothetical protein
MRCFRKKGWRKVFSNYYQYQLCRKLSTTRSSLASITSTPTALIDVVTDMTTLRSVIGYPNKTAPSASSLNINSMVSTDSAFQENRTGARTQNSREFSTAELREDIIEGTKGGDEYITNSITIQPSGLY